MSIKKNIDAEIEQLEKIIPQVREFKTLTGDAIELPPVTLGLELKVMRQFFEFMKSGGYLDSERTNQSLYDILLNAFCDDNGNRLILDICSTITGKPPDWLHDNVDLTSLAGVLLPFFVTRIQALTREAEGMAKVKKGDTVN